MRCPGLVGHEIGDKAVSTNELPVGSWSVNAPPCMIAMATAANTSVTTMLRHACYSIVWFDKSRSGSFAIRAGISCVPLTRVRNLS